MHVMTNEQMHIILKMVTMIIEGSQDKEEALEKIQELTKQKDYNEHK